MGSSYRRFYQGPEEAAAKAEAADDSGMSEREGAGANGANKNTNSIAVTPLEKSTLEQVRAQSEYSAKKKKKFSLFGGRSNNNSPNANSNDAGSTPKAAGAE